VLVYSSSRIAIFAITLAVLYAFGMRQVLLLAVAVVVSGLLSFVLLSRQRDAMSAAVVDRGSGLRQRMRERTEAEDAAADALHGESAGGETSAEGEPDAQQDREG
jgi:hypothetical protein